MSTLEKLIKYVDAASNMAESITSDIKNKGMISNDTVLYVSKFIAAAQFIEKELDMLQKKGLKLN